jgi:hypothetical protein
MTNACEFLKCIYAALSALEMTCIPGPAVGPANYIERFQRFEPDRSL